MTRIRLKDVCQTTRVFRVDGQRLRDAIEQAWNDQEAIEVDFESETIASISFLDQGIATLFVDYDSEVIRRRLKIIGLPEPDRRSLNDLISKRRAQRGAA
jgi:hypothetical protein